MVERANRGGFSTALKITQGIGLAATALAVAAAVTTVALIFATVLVPLAALWPVVIGCGCVAILGLVAFTIARGMAGKHSSREKDFSTKNDIGGDSKEMHRPYTFRTFVRGPVFWKNTTEDEFIALRDALRKMSPPLPKYSLTKNNPNCIMNLLRKHDLPKDMDRELAEKTLNVLAALPIDMLLFSFKKGALGYEFFARCNDHDIRVQILTLLEDRLLPKEVEILLLADETRNTPACDLFYEKADIEIEDDTWKCKSTAVGCEDQEDRTISDCLNDLHLSFHIHTEKPRKEYVSSIPSLS